jgi:MraZ protein
VFQGSFPYHIDDKGRLKMPADFVHGLGSAFTITRGQRGNLWILPEAEWRVLSKKLESEHLIDQRALTLQRYFIGSAVTVSLDGQGRLSVPPVLRDYAGIQHEVMVVGIGPKIELWSAAKWQEYERQVSDELIEEYARSVGL